MRGSVRSWLGGGSGPKDTVDEALYHAVNRLHFDII